MKKILAIILVLVMAACLVSCGAKPNAKDAGVMTKAQYDAAAMDSDVVIEGFITAKAYAAAWGNISFFIQDGDGAYYIYRMPCTDEDDAKLAVGQKVKITGPKTEWSGEVEIKEGMASYEIVKGEHKFKPVDITDKLASDDLIKYQNMLASVKKAKVTSAALYKWDGSGQEGDDLYFNFEVNGNEYTFLVESDLYGADTDVYKAVKALKVGDTVSFNCILYWYNGPQGWVTEITK